MEEKSNVFIPNPDYLVQVNHLKQYFPVSTGFLRTTMLKAVDDVSFDIRKGETLGRMWKDYSWENSSSTLQTYSRRSMV